ncbi:MAG: hypothetical protein RR696_15510, partial [Clostridia bacterium]
FTILENTDDRLLVTISSNLPNFDTSHFSYALIDGKKTPYISSSPSYPNAIMLSLSPNCLKTLSVGKHTLTVGFKLDA